MVRSDLQVHAELLRDASAQARQRPLLTHARKEDAYNIQAINRRCWIDGGRLLSGYKIALSTPAARAEFQVEEPIYGSLFADMCAWPDQHLPIGQFVDPMIEGEIALEIGADLCGALTDDSVQHSIARMHTAIEVPDRRQFVGRPAIADIIADNAGAAAYVLGTGIPFRASELGDTVLYRNGTVLASSNGNDSAREAIKAVAWLARQKAAEGDPLREGQVIMTGSIVAYRRVVAGDTFTFSVSGVGEAWVHFTSATNIASVRHL